MPTTHSQTATIHTTAGDIKVNLFGFHAPKTVENFIGLATGAVEWTHPKTGEKKSEPLYTNVPFHRVIDGFMIQGGDPLGLGIGGPGYEFDDEINPELNFAAPYMLAMANAGKRLGHGTNGSQFFITVAPTTWLQGAHTIFGEVADEASQQVVDSIATSPVDHNDRPLQEILITSVTVDPAA